ncbi:MAG TPA: hypothetical protein VN905_05985, partial [Candidatus Binatia bacterium]|nr:hypothetical protein [Candidatus Binatia bacterium]
NFAGNWRDAHGATGPASFASNGTSEQPVRVPTLRNVALTAPYMHDGRFATLAQVVSFYNSGIQPGPNLDPRLQRGGVPIQLNLSAADQAALVAFLSTLNDATFMTDPRFMSPFKSTAPSSATRSQKQ